MQITTGDPAVLGATTSEEGTNFAIFSAHADAVELCLFDAASGTQTTRLTLPGRDGDIWHGFVPAVRAGALYGYRVHGPFAPERGQRFNPNKLLLDPYARQLSGSFTWHKAHFGYHRDGTDKQDLSFSHEDNSAHVPKAVVVADVRCQDLPSHPHTSLADALIYEAHVRGLTRLHPDVLGQERGSFAGMGRQALVDHIKALGVTAVQLLPVHAFIDEYALHQRGLSNYWGYNTLAFFAPHPAYLSGSDIMEFRRLVDTYHDAGIEVFLDVVYNHSCESDQLGPTLSFRGIDNQSYYRLSDDNPRFYVNDTGCGNTLNINHPQVRRLVIDSLVYWAERMGVDGFRFDLAPVLGRGPDGFQREHAFFEALRAVPALAKCKLIAEPWDIGPDGYQLGSFPANWSEWNDRFRDSLRRFWRGDRGELPELARRIQGSADIFEAAGRTSSSSINYVCSHDGYTLHDLVTYTDRRNMANGEQNRDGHGENFSANYGHEGPGNDPQLQRLRQQQQRNFLALLALSQGVPMLQAGDEMGRTTHGNNNAYCQDSALNWIDWDTGLADEPGLLAFAQQVFTLRRHLSLLKADAFRHQLSDSPAGGIFWFSEDGQPMRDAQWHDADRRWLSFLLRRRGQGAPVDEVLVLMNASDNGQRFNLPRSQSSPRGAWRCVLDTSQNTSQNTSQIDATIQAAAAAGEVAIASANSLQVFLPFTGV